MVNSYCWSCLLPISMCVCVYEYISISFLCMFLYMHQDFFSWSPICWVNYSLPAILSPLRETACYFSFLQPPTRVSFWGSNKQQFYSFWAPQGFTLPLPVSTCLPFLPHDLINLPSGDYVLS